MHEIPRKKVGRGERFVRAVIVIVILACAGAGAVQIVRSAPTVKKKERRITVPLVEVRPVEEVSVRETVEVMGEIVPARKVSLSARVAGQVEYLPESFTPGGLFRKGEVLLRLDDEDPKLSLRQAQAKMASAEADLELEMGRQDVAREELRILGSGQTGDPGSSLALRGPQLAQAEAALAEARADLDKARLDLERTTVRAPFNAIILDTSVNIGSMVSAQSAVATLAGTDEFWIRASVPVTRLDALEFPSDDKPGSRVMVRTRTGDTREGRVLRLLGELTETGSMAHVLVTVPDPLGLERGNSPLLMGDLVSLRMEGRDAGKMVALPVSLLRDNATVWVAQDGKLRIRSVDIAWRERETVYLKGGLLPGEKVVSSALVSPADGTAIRVKGEPSDTGDAAEGASAGKPGAGKGAGRGASGGSNG